MGIVRVAKNSNYVVMNRTALNDKRLSWKAKGIMAYLLSMPDDWVFYMEELQSHSTDGKASFQSGFKELKDCGYVERLPVKDDETGKITHWETVVHEIPIDTKPHTEKPVSGKSIDWKTTSMENHEVDNQPLLSTDINQVLNKPNTDKKEEEKGSPNPFIFYQENGFGVLSSYVSDKLNNWIDDLSEEHVIYAMQIAVENNSIRWNYVEKILKDWFNRNLKTMEAVHAARAQFEAQKGGKPNGSIPRQQGSSRVDAEERLRQQTERLKDFL
ncbi:DnaD domain protein [Solibacillus sp. FSL K6-1781]|uniref:DnaD domain-containing protein n=1 Tax=Solibacillus sp. FSL K6-1781 TaxID=2921474 RepID=UPI00315AAD5A